MQSVASMLNPITVLCLTALLRLCSSQSTNNCCTVVWSRAVRQCGCVMMLHIDAYLVDLMHVLLDYYGVFYYCEFLSCVCICIVLMSLISQEEFNQCL